MAKVRVLRNKGGNFVVSKACLNKNTMRFFKKAVRGARRLSNLITFRHSGLEVQHLQNFFSQALDREVRVDIFLPPGYFSETTFYPVLFFNDGQDMEAVQMAATLENLYNRNKIPKIIVVAIHANQERMNEYGIASQADYKNRGAKAKNFTQFILKELIPTIQKRYRCASKVEDWVYGGFSLGGLSAFDIVWQHPEVFGKVGVFSGSFWWRSKPVDPADPDAHRIMQYLLSKDKKRPGLKFWLQTGTEDEQEDRNNNGIIDAIDDTLDIIKALKNMGYREGDDIHYVEIKGGQHNLPTWSRIMPEFLQWAFGK